MRVIAVDDEPFALEQLKEALHEFPELTEIRCFGSPMEALDWLEENQAEIAFLDINMEQMDGLAMAKRLKELCPDCAVVFVTGYSEYAVQAFKVRASGYLMKPVRKADIQEELDYIQNPRPAARPEGQVRVRCFGNFEVFAGDEPMKFQYAKTKELLAYLVDRKGAFCSHGEIISILWEDRTYSSGLSSQLRNLLADLTAAFKAAGCGDAILRRRGMTAIVPEKIRCDFYDWEKGDIDAVNAYGGEYMSQYGWGEFTLGGLETVKKRK